MLLIFSNTHLYAFCLPFNKTLIIIFWQQSEFVFPKDPRQFIDPTTYSILWAASLQQDFTRQYVLQEREWGGKTSKSCC